MPPHLIQLLNATLIAGAIALSALPSGGLLSASIAVEQVKGGALST